MATSKLQENLSRYFYSGVALAVHTVGVAQKSVDEFAKRNKMNEADGKKIVDEAMKKIDAQRLIIETRYNDALRKLMHLSTDEVSKLQKRIGHLEKKSSAKRNGTSATAKTPVNDIKKAGTNKKITATAKRNVA